MVKIGLDCGGLLSVHLKNLRKVLVRYVARGAALMNLDPIISTQLPYMMHTLQKTNPVKKVKIQNMRALTFVTFTECYNNLCSETMSC